jgi:hypothetical protein
MKDWVDQIIKLTKLSPRDDRDFCSPRFCFKSNPLFRTVFSRDQFLDELKKELHKQSTSTRQDVYAVGCPPGGGKTILLDYISLEVIKNRDGWNWENFFVVPLMTTYNSEMPGNLAFISKSYGKKKLFFFF